MCHDLYRQALLTQQLVTSEAVLCEVRGTLQKKFKLPPEDVRQVAARIIEEAEVIVPVPLPKPVCRDRDDDVVLAAAVTGRADCIVTGDDDLLVLKKWGGVRILSPRQFLELLDQRP